MKFSMFLLVLVPAAIVSVGLFVKKRLERLRDVRFTDTLGGAEAPNFQVNTTDGRTVDMNSLLEGKEVLAAVLFATWCGPCEKEFPEMDEVYRKYSNRMGMIAIDVDALDDEKAVKEYAEKHHLSFPVAKGNDSLGVIKATMYPTTLIIDRTGRIGLWRVGSIPDAETFEKIVTTFMGDTYQPRQLGYYTFMAAAGRDAVPGVTFTVTSGKGEETFTTGENGKCEVFTDQPEDLKVKVIRVPEGYSIDGEGELMSGTGCTCIFLPVRKK